MKRRLKTYTGWKSLEDLVDAACNGELELADAEGRTGLHYAVLDRDIHLVRGALGAGADVDAADISGWTALHYAVHVHDVTLCKLLIENGADVDAVDDHGNTPLWRAVFESHGRSGIVEALIEANADADRKNNHGTSPKDLSKTIANFPAAIPAWVKGGKS